MAYIEGSKEKTKSLNVDLTPMVDLGFLLISFFVFTTTILKPVSLGIIMPDDSPMIDPSLLSEKDAIHLILPDAEHIYNYNGSDVNTGQITNYSPQGLRSLFTQYKKDYCNIPGSLEKKCVLIKPSAEATTGNIVDILDEITIAGFKKYVLLESSPAELDIALTYSSSQ